MNHTTLYDLLVFRALDRYGEDAHDGNDTEGDHSFVNALGSAVFEKDEEYLKEKEKLRIEYEAGLESDSDEYTLEEWTLRNNYRHLALMVACFKRHGHLDSAPIPESSEGADFL